MSGGRKFYSRFTVFDVLDQHGEPKYVERIRDRVRVNRKGCWVWQGKTDGKGYGRLYYPVKFGAKEWPRVHRITYYMVFGEMPELLDHFYCDNKSCCNPFHVRPETFKNNVLRGTGPTAINKRKTHCPQGHEYTPDNTKILRSKEGKEKGRRCKTCFNANRQQRRRLLVDAGYHPHSRHKDVRQRCTNVLVRQTRNSVDRAKGPCGA
jgi:hypothetical protein